MGPGPGPGWGQRRGRDQAGTGQELALTTCPDVHGFAVGLFAQDLRGQVAGCACKSWDRDRERGEERQVSYNGRGQGQDTVQDTGLGHGHEAGMCWAGVNMVGTEAWTWWLSDRAVLGTGQMQ